MLALLVAAGCGSVDPQASVDGGEPADAGTRADAGPPPERALCVDGQSVDGVYPRGPYAFAFDETLPDLAFAGRGEAGEARTVSLHDWFDPCAPRAKLLVLRFTAPWCGTCRWDATHTGELLDALGDAPIELLDVLVADEDNHPATLDTIDTWRGLVDRPRPTVIDSIANLAALNVNRESLPFVVLVDARTMRLRYRAGNQDPETLRSAIRRELARLDGQPLPQAEPIALVDGRFTRREWDLIAGMRDPGAPPPDPTNHVADRPEAAALGAALFADPGLSPSGQVSCATCHATDRALADGRPQAIGVAAGPRNTPSILFAAHARWQFWDGRADTLWAQALAPFENPLEFDASRSFVAHRIATAHRDAYEATFGSLPDLSSVPAHAKPGDPVWESLPAATRSAATEVFVNAGKAIAAFERTFRAGPNRLDAYAAGDFQALTELEKSGLKTFLISGCVQCHWGPRLTDDAFHALRFPTGRRDGLADPGRVDVVGALLLDEFRADGPWSDDPGAVRRTGSLAAVPWLVGAFKTPPLRGVPDTAPYGHGGTLATLDEVLEVYATAGLPPDDERATGVTEPWVPLFARRHIEELKAFLEVLEAEAVP